MSVAAAKAGPGEVGYLLYARAPTGKVQALRWYLYEYGRTRTGVVLVWNVLTFLVDDKESSDSWWLISWGVRIILQDLESVSYTHLTLPTKA